MERLDEFEVRKAKIEDLREKGLEPYPYRFEKTHDSLFIKEHFDELEGKTVSIAGRIITKRVFGKLSFAHLRDEQGDIQIAIQKNLFLFILT